MASHLSSYCSYLPAILSLHGIPPMHNGPCVASSHQIIWVDLRSETLSSFDTVLRRLGSPLKRVTYIAPSPLPPSLHPQSTPNAPQPPLFSPEPTLSPTVASVRSALSSSPKALVVLDGLSELLDMGFSAISIFQAIRAVLADVRTSGGCLISTAHENEDLTRRLIRLGPWWRVSGLTPRSGEVSGEISAVPVPAGVGPAVSRDKAVQFRLEPAAVRAFPKGTGRGYL
ncbi:hypothetical protein CC85DRAFT_284562 [Cutaneotrichosporon oleaginosum]|uniref:Elongator complex protein 5 n=1 Tax=Cutaneotrichosporon oleaginosum TaxID=879819 RepID=A0A0J0XQR5_9TREE|nr:uncharacterized protein CC85DRAFT_284562 [Cutaneotrichosporon oleaginosum]KLT43417.1 hypothetical protein CC85DRAFT_284562 [Cutaneotrichosporon oleaginosum]TXT05369.1 hypothetical protein COLE_06689 [Cutaneotrichosporon oleaginosum]